MRVRVRGSRRASCARTFRVFAACLSVLCASVAQQGIAAASPSPVDLTSLVSPVGPASAGGIASFDIAVTNAGGTQATAPVDVTFSPGGLVATSPVATGDGWQCTSSRCTTDADVAPGAQLPDIHVQVPVYVDRTTTSTSSGQVQLSSNVNSTQEGVPNNDGSSASIGVRTGTNLDAILLIRPPASPPARGQSADFEAEIANVGRGTLTSRVEVVFSTALSGQGSGWTCPASAGRCVSDGDIVAGAKLPTLVLRQPTSETSGSTTTSVSARVETTDDPSTANNSGSASTPLIGTTGADLVVAMRPGTVAVQGSSSVSLVGVRNVGFAATAGPIEVAYSPSSASASGPGWTCPVGAGRCVTSPVLQPGDALPDLELRAPTSASSSSASASATVSGGNDGLSLNNSASLTMPVSRLGDLVDVLAWGTARADDPAARSVTWTVDVANRGALPSSGDTLVVLDQPTANSSLGGGRGLPFETSGDGWVCSNRHCLHPAPIAAGAQLPPLRQTVALPPDVAAGSVSFGASVQADGDVFTTNNSAVNTTLSTGGIRTDLGVTVSADRSVRVGESAGASIRVRNLGAARAQGPVDVLVSSSVTGGVVSGQGWNCGSDRRCTHPGPVDAGASLPVLQVTAPTTTGQVGSQSFSATVQADDDDVTSNNSGSSAYGVGGPIADVVPSVRAIGPWQAGEVGRSTVTVSNAGPDARADGVTVRLSAPTATVARGDGWSCASTLECTHAGPIPAGATLPAIDVLSPLSSTQSATTMGVNATLVSSGDEYPYNDILSTAVPVATTSAPGGLQLHFTRSQSGDVRPGQSENISLAVRNGSSADAPGPFAVRLTPSRSVTVESVAGGGWSCDAELVCRRILGLAAGEASTLAIVARPSTSSTNLESLLATARQAGTTAPVVAASLPLPLSSVSGIDLLQEIDAGDATPAGGVADFRLRVRNGGEIVARGRVEVRLGTSGRVSGSVTASGPGWSCPRNSDRCTTDADVPPGGALPDIAVLVPATEGTAGSSIALDSSLVGIDEDAYPANNAARARTPIVAASGIDLVTRIVAAQGVRAGQQASATLTVSNLGSEAATGLLTARYGVSGASGTPEATGSGWSCSNLRCVRSGSVGPGETLPPITVSAATVQDRTSGYNVLNFSGSVDHPDDAVDQNNSASESLPLFAATGVDLVYGLAPQSAPSALGGPQNYLGTVRNVGDQAATARIEVSLPSSWLGSGPGWTCPRGSGRCVTDADVASGATLPAVTLTDPTTPIDPNSRSASGDVFSPEDSVSNYNSASVTAPSAPGAGGDLVALLTPGVRASAGDPAPFTATIRNAGGTAVTAPVTVRLSPTTATAAGSGWSCTNEICTTDGDIAPAAALPPLVVSLPTSTSSAMADVSLTVSGPDDSAPGNDTARATAGLRRPITAADVMIEGDLTAPAHMGGAVSWSMTAINGGSSATALPVTLTFDRPSHAGRSTTATAAGDGWTCTTSLVCTHAPVAAGSATAPVVLSFTALAADGLGIIDMGASASAGAESSTSNNSAAIDFGVGGASRDLIATLTSDPGARADEGIAQAARVRNVGSEAVSGPVELAISRPSSDVVVSGAGWNCDTPTRCTHPGPVAPGAALPDVSITSPAQPVNPSQVRTTSVNVSATADTLTTNDAASISVGRGGPQIDLGPEVTPGPAIRQGDIATFAITLRNGGTRAATASRTLKVTAPTGATAAGTGWTCTSDLSCTHASAVAPGGVLPLLTVSVPTPARDGLGLVSVSASLPQSDDQYTSNNSGSASVAVGGPGRDLTAIVSSLGRWRAGSAATFQVKVANHGSQAADGDVDVALNVPYSGATATGTGWICISTLRCIHGGPVAPGETLPPLNVSVPVPSNATPSAISAGVSVDNPSDRITTNNSTDLVTGIERKLEVRRAALFDAESQRARLPQGGATRVSIALSEGISPQQGRLTATLPTGLQLDPGRTGPALTDPTTQIVAGGTRVSWALAASSPDADRYFTVKAVPSAPVGSTAISVELASELTASPEADDAPLTIARPTITTSLPTTISSNVGQTLSIAGTDIDPDHQFVLRRGATTLIGTSNASAATARTAIFDTSSMAPGPATLALLAADGTELAVAPSPIQVTDAVYRDPEVAITGPSAVRLNTEGFFYVSVHNSSNADITNVPLVVTTPAQVELRPDGSGGREVLAQAVESLATEATPAAQRLNPAQRDSVIAGLASSPPVEADPETGGRRTIVVMPRIPAGGTARLRVGVTPRAQVAGVVRARVLIDRDRFELTGAVTDPVAQYLKRVNRSRSASGGRAANPTAGIDCSGEYAEACAQIRRTQTAIDEGRRIGQENLCTSFTGGAGGIVGADCQFDPTGPVNDVVEKKFPGIGIIQGILNAFGLYRDLSDAADKIENASGETQFGVRSTDPNDKLGPAGYGSDHWLSGDDPLTYTIRFENIRAATASAQQVRVTDAFPPELDPSTVQIVGAEIGGKAVPLALDASSPPLLKASGSAVLDPLTSRDVLADVSLNQATGEFVTTFRGSPHLDDPFTPTPFGDFLPPNADDRRGEGSITFAVRAKSNLSTGTTITNVAAIVFDPHNDGPRIDTPPAKNRLDRSAPVVTPPGGSVVVGAALAFGATDEGSGIDEIVVTPFRGGTALSPIVVDRAARTFKAPSDPGSYEFEVRVVDGVGRVTTSRGGAVEIKAAPAAAPENPAGSPAPGGSAPATGGSSVPRPGTSGPGTAGQSKACVAQRAQLTAVTKQITKRSKAIRKAKGKRRKQLIRQLQIDQAKRKVIQKALTKVCR